MRLAAIGSYLPGFSILGFRINLPPLPDISDLAGSSGEELKRKWNASLEQVHTYFKEASAKERKLLTPILEKLDFDHISTFFDHLMENGADLPKDLFQILPPKVVSDEMGNIDGFEGWAKEMTECLGKEVSSGHSVNEANSRPPSVIASFFPNMGRILMKAFSLFDEVRAPDTLYEYGVLVTLYFHFFHLPYALFQTIAIAVTPPIKAALYTLLTLAAAVGLLYLYQRWFQGCPAHVTYCENWSERHRKGQLSDALYRDKEYAEAANYMSTGKGLVLVGPPGIGKTAWMQGMAAQFPEKKVFGFNNLDLFKTGPYRNAGEKVANALREVAGYEEKTVFCLDELGKSYKNNEGDVETILTEILCNERYEKISFVAALTTEQWEGIKKDPSLERRFHAIQFEPMSSDQMENVLWKRLGEYPRVPVTPEAVSKIVTCATNIGKDGSALSRAVGDLDVLINRIRNFRPEEYETAQLRESKAALEALRSQAQRSLKPERYIQKIKEAKQRVSENTEAVSKQRLQAAAVQKLLAMQQSLQLERNRIVRKAGDGKGVAETEKVKARWIHFMLLDKLEKKIEKKMAELDPSILLRLDEKAVERFYQEKKGGNGE